jgi:hypothetical protein
MILCIWEDVIYGTTCASPDSTMYCYYLYFIKHPIPLIRYMILPKKTNQNANNMILAK